MKYQSDEALLKSIKKEIEVDIYEALQQGIQTTESELNKFVNEKGDKFVLPLTQITIEKTEDNKAKKEAEIKLKESKRKSKKDKKEEDKEDSKNKKEDSEKEKNKNNTSLNEKITKKIDDKQVKKVDFYKP